VRSIRRQLTLNLLGGFGLLLICSMAAIYLLIRLALLKEFDASLHAKAWTIISATEFGRDGLHVELPDDYFAQANDDATPQYYELWQADGRVCARSPSLTTVDLPRRFASADAPAYWNISLPGGHAGRAVGLEFSPKAEDEHRTRSAPPKAVIVVATDRQPLDRTLNTLAIVLIVTGIITVCITVPLINVSLRRGHAPLDELSRQAAAINADSLSRRFSVDALPGELRPITSKLNDLLSRLEQSFARERRFSADLAHELRTPLAELRSHAEVELAWPQKGDAQNYREILDIALQMEAMVSRLLELARGENGKIALQIETVPVAQLADEVWQSLAVKAVTKRLAVDFRVPGDARVQTDRTLFRSILVNLLSNSIEYTPQAGHLTIEWHNELQKLTVANTVQDLSPDDLPHLFERLWRKDKSRTGTEHCGLGLALSKEYASLLNLNLSASFTTDNSLAMTLQPLRPGLGSLADRKR
jgi:signal transduction histidine kinase